MPKAFNAVTAQINQLDMASHPVFKRLFGEAGFQWLTSQELENFISLDGLKMLVFADDPNERKTTLDIAVIAPELKKAFNGALTATAWADFKESRSMAARWGLRSMPVVAIFQNKDLLGAVQGLKPWDEYCSLLSEIVIRNKPVVRTIAIMPVEKQDSCDC